MDSRNVYCVKETRCIWRSVFTRTPHAGPRGRGAGHSAADECYNLYSHPVRDSTIPVREVGSSAPDERQTLRRPPRDIPSRSVPLSFTMREYRSFSKRPQMLKSRPIPRSRCIKALSNQFSWIRYILWAEQWNARSSPFPLSCRRMKWNSEIPELIPSRYATPMFGTH